MKKLTTTHERDVLRHRSGDLTRRIMRNLTIKSQLSANPVTGLFWLCALFALPALAALALAKRPETSVMAVLTALLWCNVLAGALLRAVLQRCDLSDAEHDLPQRERDENADSFRSRATVQSRSNGHISHKRLWNHR